MLRNTLFKNNYEFVREVPPSLMILNLCNRRDFGKENFCDRINAKRFLEYIVTYT